MLQKILDALIKALNYVFASRETVAALKKQIEDRDQIISDLHAALEFENADDASLEAAVEDAKAAQKKVEDELAALNASIEEANTKATELANIISEDSEIPITVSPNGEVNSP